MKFSICLVGCVLMAAATAEDVKNEAPDDSTKKASYIFGYEMAGQLKRMEVTVDIPAFMAGLRDMMEKRPMRFSQEERAAVMQAFQEKQSARIHEKAKDNIDAAKKFLEEHKTKEGVVVRPTGLQYRVVKAGEGASPSGLEKVRVHYAGKLMDGTVFDSSYKRGEPLTFMVSRVIPGWAEALKLMKVGSKWELVIPPHLGYGERGAGGTIPPNAVLLFDVELLEIVKD